MSKKVKEMIGGCCVCSDECGWNENPLVYCDGPGCNVAVHQACYGIVQVPTGPWYCKKCQSQERVARVKCELCPQKAGAMKKTGSGGWCHVVCALYIPEAWFANVQTMEPIVLRDVPSERFNKTCYICEEQKRDTKATAGACMQCNRNSCKQYFHVTCAQAQGLLCEVTSSLKNVKYCGYCSHHYKKLKNLSNVKTIPAFKPIPVENGTPDSSPEKNTPNNQEEDTKQSNPPTIQEVKSPQVDQSVSSTSDSVPPPLIPSIKPEAPPAGCIQQVSDISSAVSPSGEDMKSPQSGAGSDQNQEPSSSGVVSQTQTPTLHRMLQEGGASSSTETWDVDVGDASMEVSNTARRASSPSTGASKGSAPVVTKRQSGQRSLSSKKTKSGMISSLTHRKEGVKKIPGKKRRDSGGASNKGEPVSVSAPSATATSLPGHHDYCGNIFGGSPYFQSLSAPGHVSLPSFSSQAMFPSFPYGSESYFYGTDAYMDTSAMMNGPSTLIPPPKHFPSLSGRSFKHNDHSQENFPLTMEQLLEYQWEEGAQFLMQQGQHFDIASLLNTLHRLKGENQSLEDQVRELTTRRDHLKTVNARLSLPLSYYDGGSSNSKSSSLGSLEDISSPDDVQTPKLGPTSLASVQIPSNSDLMVEDILSPVETDHPSLSSSHLKSMTDDTSPSHSYIFPDQVGHQPLMYSVVNPPPPSLSMVSPSLSTLQSSSSSSSSLSSLSQANMPALEPTQTSQMPSLNSLSLSGHLSKLQDTT